MSDIGVFGDQGSVDMEVIDAFAERMGVLLPRKYKALLSEHNGLYPAKPCFDFVNPWGQVDCRAIAFYGYGTRYGEIGNFQPSLLDPCDAEVQGIVAIGEDGGGDKICFDYRDCPGTDDPPVVFLYHDLWWPDEAGEWHRVIWPLAPSFDAFLEMLHEEEDPGDGGGVDGISGG